MRFKRKLGRLKHDKHEREEIRKLRQCASVIYIPEGKTPDPMNQLDI